MDSAGKVKKQTQFNFNEKGEIILSKSQCQGGINLQEGKEDINMTQNMTQNMTFTQDKKQTIIQIMKQESKEDAEDMILGDEQVNAFNIVVYEEKSVFITGKAGAGKSMLLRKIINALNFKRVFVTASTGVAALQVGGTTLHTFLGVGLATSPIDNLIKKAKANKNTRERLKKCEVLVIDEVSMIKPDFFIKCDLIMRAVRRCDFPFGGVQLVLCGDFFQLPPITKSEELEEFEFLFETNSWKEKVEEIIVLNKIWRQHEDPIFANILNNMRLGSMEPEDISLLQNKVRGKTFSKLDETHETHENDENDESNKEVNENFKVKPTIMYSLRKDIQIINQRELAALPGKERIFDASFWTEEKKNDPREKSAYARKKVLESSKKNVEKYFRTPLKLLLKVGAQVMLTWNKNVSNGLVNGARGVVTKFVSDLPMVKFTTGQSLVIKHKTLEVNFPQYGTLYFRQVPLELAWASTIHKCQGLTLTSAEISVDRSMFAYGQAYVAMSRVRTLNGIKLTSFSEKFVRAHPKVIEFYSTFDLELKERKKRKLKQKYENLFCLPSSPTSNKKIKK
jgi:ATP-dependent DNA helicase PIF1